MKDFNRTDLLFSLCGLNCGLCPMKLDGYCPGCGGGTGNQSCTIARCSIERGNFAYCFECPDYPCARYEGIDEYDSFITHRNQLTDIEKAMTIGIASYHKEQSEKQAILKKLLSEYNDGRRKAFYCIAVNLLELSELKDVMNKLSEERSLSTLKEKATTAVEFINDVAKLKNIMLKLNKKPNKK